MVAAPLTCAACRAAVGVRLLRKESAVSGMYDHLEGRFCISVRHC